MLLSKIEREEDIEKIGDCVCGIIGAGNEEVARGIVNHINIDTFSSKIEKEEDLVNIWLLVDMIAKENKEVGLKLIDSLSSKIEKEKDIMKIVSVIQHVEVSKIVALKLTSAISSRIEKEKNIVTIGRCMKNIAYVNKEVGLKLVNRLDIDILSAKIEKEETIWEIGFCIGGIRWANKEVARKIVNRLNPELREELQREGWL